MVDLFEQKSRSHSLQDLEQYASPHTLPLRPSETPPRNFGFPNAMTPAHSDHSSNNSPAPLFDEMHFPDGQADVDMEDDDLDITCSQPPDSPLAPFLRPARLNAQLFQEPSCGGRIPTPIHGTFYPRLPSQPTGDVSNMDLEDVAIIATSRKQPERDRRMPSPISEDEADSTTMTESQLSRLSVRGTEGMEIDETMRSAGPTAKKGRARSGAITDKRKFSMGYRDDCDKCRARVPGHYSHFLTG